MKVIHRQLKLSLMWMQTMSGRALFSRLRPAISAATSALGLLPRPLLRALWSATSHWGGTLALGLRFCLLRNLAMSCGENVAIHKDVYLLGLENIAFGSNVSIHPMSYLDGTGGITIGNDVSIAHGVTIMSTSHSHDCEDVPIKYAPVVKRAVRIGNDVWIGAKAVILFGVSIHGGSVVGACSLVNRDVAERWIVAGVPAKPLKQRARA